MALGYVQTYKPPAPRKPALSLALAAAGAPSAANPFGFRTARNTTAFAAPTAAAPVQPRRPVSAATSPVVAPAARPGVNPTVTAPAAPPTPAVYDINTDPALQQVGIDAGLSDEQANAQALKERQQLALGYGSSEFARALGLDDSYAAAAAGNPSSTLAQLGQQRDRNSKSLTDQLNSANLLYSGYRVTQEQQAAQDYQNALAQAAAGVNSASDTIGSNLSGVLLGNQKAREQAINDAYNRSLQQALANPPAAPSSSSGGTGTGGTETAAAPHDLPLPEDQQPAPADTGGVFPNTLDAIQNAAAVQAAASPTTSGTWPNLDAAIQAAALAMLQKPKSGYSAGSGSNLH